MRGKEERKIGPMYKRRAVVHYETSLVLLLEHWMPAKDDEENKQLVVVEKVHMLSLV